MKNLFFSHIFNRFQELLHPVPFTFLCFVLNIMICMEGIVSQNYDKGPTFCFNKCTKYVINQLQNLQNVSPLFFCI